MLATSYHPLRPLHEGASVALVAPSGILPDPSHIEQAVENVRSLGWNPVLGENVAMLHGYLAGTDEQRSSDLNAAFRNDSVDAIWCIRGGYGAMRLLPEVDYAALRANPRPVIGFSDITALHSAIYRECGLVSFHGPTARGELGDFSRSSLETALVGQGNPCGVALAGRVLRPGRARGRLAGGNLALVTAMMGTPWSVDFEGAILIIEDVDEAVYRVDRMMQQLLLSGALAQCVALVAGDFRPPAGEVEHENRAFDDVIAEAADRAGIPCIAGAPFGHIRDQWTIPLGALAEVDTATLSLHVGSE
ncbi:MAG: LD-carboxypeptidase [Gemmatimonadaceae bacterium]